MPLLQQQFTDATNRQRVVSVKYNNSLNGTHISNGGVINNLRSIHPPLKTEHIVNSQVSWEENGNKMATTIHHAQSEHPVDYDLMVSEHYKELHADFAPSGEPKIDFRLGIWFWHDAALPVPQNPPVDCNPQNVQLASDGLPFLAPRSFYVTPREWVKEQTGIKVYQIDYQPCGHPPFAFQKPHYDVHFMYITREEMGAMTCNQPPGAPICNPTPGSQTTSGAAFFDFPPNHDGIANGMQVDMEAALPQSGIHWFDHSILNQSWQKPVFVQGTYNASIVFAEGMFPLDFDSGDWSNDGKFQARMKEPTLYLPEYIIRGSQTILLTKPSVDTVTDTLFTISEIGGNDVLGYNVLEQAARSFTEEIVYQSRSSIPSYPAYLSSVSMGASSTDQHKGFFFEIEGKINPAIAASFNHKSSVGLGLGIGVGLGSIIMFLFAIFFISSKLSSKRESAKTAVAVDEKPSNS